ncbi:hypothetical protein PV327_008120 [Microctonus hyperodae]|uniref:E3 ubiquitin-protein ligase RBBP6 n=1 Tax=Microctonus hyperodae TaxID=165561 RepID=A0AA39F2H3_MICHY|nr:hypothetical protein PV327_008120 [Microctonus hyperodae]
MSVHYKFKSTLDYDTVSFDGLHISVYDLKKAIFHQKRIGKNIDFDLQVTNAQTKEDYTNDDSLIANNTSLIVSRVPLNVEQNRAWDRCQPQAITGAKDDLNSGLTVDSRSSDGGLEDNKIQPMINQPTQDNNSSNEAYKENKRELSSFFNNQECAVEKPEIPEDLLCNICKDLLTDAVMIPCCGNSYCDECIRTVLLESEEHECPDCNEKDVLPETLIPNRFLRNSVMTFKNETGYIKRRINISTVSSEPNETQKIEMKVAITQDELKESSEKVPITQSHTLQSPKDASKIPTNTGVKDSILEPIIQSEKLPESIVENEKEVLPLLPPGTEPLLSIPSITGLKQDDRNLLPTMKKKNCEKAYVHEVRFQECRPGFNKESRHERIDVHRVGNLRPTSKRRSLSPKQSHRINYPIKNTSVPQSIIPTNEYSNLPPTDTSRYTSNVDCLSGIRRSSEDRSGTPTVDEPHLQAQISMNQTSIHRYPPVDDRVPPNLTQNCNQIPGMVSHNPPLLSNPYINHPRMNMYPRQQGPYYGPSRYDRTQYQQPRFRMSQPPCHYNAPPRPLAELPDRGYHGIQAPILAPQPQIQQLSLSLPHPEPVRNIHNGIINPGIIDDPLEAFERMLREKDERDRRFGKHRRRTRSRSRTRSYSRSRSRSFSRRTPLSSCISRSRSPLTKRRSSRSPLSLKQHNKTPKKRSRSGSFSISRSRSYSRSQSSRGSVTRERECERERSRDWDRESLLRYKSPIRSPTRFQKNRDRHRARSRESREKYNGYYKDSQTNNHELRDRDSSSTRVRLSGRYTSRSQSSQHNIPPLLPHLTAEARPPPLMSLGAPDSERKDYYDSYNRYTGSLTQQYNNSPLREPHYKRLDDVASSKVKTHYDPPSSGISSSKDDRDRSQIGASKEVEDRTQDLEIDKYHKSQSRNERTYEHEVRRREKGSDRREFNQDRERDKNKDDRDRLITCGEREERMRDKHDRERRDKEENRDTERFNRDRQMEKTEYDKQRYRSDYDRNKLENKSSRTNRERKERGQEIEKNSERQDRYERRSVDRQKSQNSCSPHLKKKRSNIEYFSPERLKKKGKDYHEDKTDEKLKEKRVREKKRKKDIEEKEKKKKKKKDKKLIPKEIPTNELSKTLFEPEIITSDIKMKDAELLEIKSHDIEINDVQLMNNTDSLDKLTASTNVMEFEEKSLINDSGSLESSEQKLSRQVDAELSRNPPNPNFKQISELKSNSKSIDNIYGDLDRTKINVSETYSLVSNFKDGDENENLSTNDDKQLTLTPQHEVNDSEKITMPFQIVSRDTYVREKSPTDSKKDEFLAPMPELSKWERDDNNTEKLDETVIDSSSENILIQDESKPTKVVTSEVLKRAENAIFQKAINAIRPIEIKKISDSRKMLYQNPENKNLDLGINRDIRKNVNVTIDVSKNERNVEITEPFKKSKLDRSKFRIPSETHSPTRLSVRDRLGEKVEKDKVKISIPLKPFLESTDVNKYHSGTSQSPKLTGEEELSPIMKRRVKLSSFDSSSINEREVVSDERKQEKETSELTQEKCDRKCEKFNSKVEKDIEKTSAVDSRADRIDRIEKERKRDRDQDVQTSHSIAYNHESSEKSTFSKRRKIDEDGDKKTRGDKKHKKEQGSRNKSRDRKKRKEKKRKKDKSKVHEKKTKYTKYPSDSRNHTQIIEDKNNLKSLDLLSQDEQSTTKQRKILKHIMDRKRSADDEVCFGLDYSALESALDPGKSKLCAQKSKLMEQQINVSQETETIAVKQKIVSKSSLDDSNSSATSLTVSDSSDDSRRKRKKKHKKHKKSKSSKKDSSTDTDSDSDSTNSSSDEEKYKKKSKKSKNKSSQPKRKRKSRHK